jgi:glycosyltransferase involved in cell wall biosynthesis
VSTTDLGGGAEGSAWNLFQGYRQRGHQSWLAVGEKRSADPDVLRIPNEHTATAWGRCSSRLQARLRAVESRVPGAWRLSQWLRLLTPPQRWRDRWRGIEDMHHPGTHRLLELPPQTPDLVHCHNLHGGYFDLRALPALSRRVPVVLNLRDMWLLTGHCVHFFDCERWVHGCGQCPSPSIRAGIPRDGSAENWERKRRIYAESRLYVVAPSQWVIDRARRSILHAVEYRIIPNAVDLDVYYPASREHARAALGLRADARIVLFAAQNVKSNRFKDYATTEAAISRAAERSDGSILFVCLGEEAEAKQIGKARIHFAGFQRDPREVALYYRAADVYIHAARAEVWGKTVTEALACGTPVVATAVGGIPEQIRSLHFPGCAETGRPEHPAAAATGILVPPGDAAAMANGICHLLADAELRLQLGANAARDAQARFDLRLQVDAFLEWYREILAREAGETQEAAGALSQL